MTTPLVTIGRALAEERLLGAALGDPSTWATWAAVLQAAHGERLTARELVAFRRVAGGRDPPRRKVRQLAIVASRRAGKGRAAAGLAVHASTLVDHSAVLAPGEVGVVAVVSPTREQARIVQRYALGFLEASPILRDQIAEVSADEIRLRNGNVICTLAVDFRTLRGRTLLLAILDEASFLRDETSSTSDIEAARALLPGLATTGGMLVVLSSPYRRAGLLFQLYRDHFGRDGDDVLVVAGPSIEFNPTLDPAVIEAERAADPQAALSEWDGQFRNDLSAFLDDALIDAAVDRGRPMELPPRDGVRYFAFTDASAGRHDSFTISIVHRERDRVVADVVRGRKPPFDPASVAAEHAGLAKEYRCRRIVGDNFAGNWVADAFRAAGVEYRCAELPRSELYLEGLPLFTRGLVRIPDNPLLLRELRLLERRTARSGRDSVDHGVGGSDDFANALFGAMNLAVGRQPIIHTMAMVAAIQAAPRHDFATTMRAVNRRGTPGHLAGLYGERRAAIMRGRGGF